EIVAADRFQVTLVDRKLEMRVGGDVSVSREVLADARHAALLESMEEACGQLGHDRGCGMQGTIPDDAAHAVVEVEHRRKRKTHAARRELGGNHDTRSMRGGPGAVWITLPERANAAHRWHAGKALPETLHPPAFVVDADEKARLAQ